MTNKMLLVSLTSNSERASKIRGVGETWGVLDLFFRRKKYLKKKLRSNSNQFLFYPVSQMKKLSKNFGKNMF